MAYVEFVGHVDRRPLTAATCLGLFSWLLILQFAATVVGKPSNN